MEIASLPSGRYFPRLSKTKQFTTAEASLPSASALPEKVEIKVCSNRTCRKQGSLNIFQVLSGIAPPHVTVNSCGCLGQCGAGPNIVVLPEGALFGHCGTARKAADVMSALCGAQDGSYKCLEALALRKRAEDEMGRGDFTQASTLLTQALDLKPFGGVHLIYKDRSAARLGMGDINGALDDAREATVLAPNNPEVYICKGDAFMENGQYDESEQCYSIAMELNPSIRKSKSFKARVQKLQEKLVSANSS